MCSEKKCSQHRNKINYVVWQQTVEFTKYNAQETGNVSFRFDDISRF